jgi:hypothetical protein
MSIEITRITWFDAALRIVHLRIVVWLVFIASSDLKDVLKMHQVFTFIVRTDVVLAVTILESERTLYRASIIRCAVVA